MFGLIKRTLVLCAVAAVLAGPPFFVTSSQVPSALTVGTPQAISLGADNTLSEILITVQKGWLKSDKFALDIYVTGFNGVFKQHGGDMALVSAIEAFGSDKDLAEVVVDWTADTEPVDIGEVYTVCVQVVFPSDSVFGEEKCADFGPF